MVGRGNTFSIFCGKVAAGGARARVCRCCVGRGSAVCSWSNFIGACGSKSKPILGFKESISEVVGPFVEGVRPVYGRTGQPVDSRALAFKMA